MALTRNWKINNFQKYGRDVPLRNTHIILLHDSATFKIQVAYAYVINIQNYSCDIHVENEKMPIVFITSSSEVELNILFGKVILKRVKLR